MHKVLRKKIAEKFPRCEITNGLISDELWLCPDRIISSFKIWSLYVVKMAKMTSFLHLSKKSSFSIGFHKIDRVKKPVLRTDGTIATEKSLNKVIFFVK